MRQIKMGFCRCSHDIASHSHRDRTELRCAVGWCVCIRFETGITKKVWEWVREDGKILDTQFISEKEYPNNKPSIQKVKKKASLAQLAALEKARNKRKKLYLFAQKQANDESCLKSGVSAHE